MRVAEKRSPLGCRPRLAPGFTEYSQPPGLRLFCFLSTRSLKRFRSGFEFIQEPGDDSGVVGCLLV